MSTTAPTLDRSQILAVVAQTGHLPAAPRAIAQVESELARPSASARHVADLIQLEPALCAAVLRIANSALHAPRREVTCVTQAVTHLGMDAIRRIVLVSSMIRSWQRYSTTSLHRFWIHSVAVGLTSAELPHVVRSDLDPALEEAVFAAGLLHDLGVLLLGGL